MSRAQFLERLVAHYKKRKFQVFGLLPGLLEMPAGWRGPFPDLYAQKGGRRLAVYLETPTSLLDEQETGRILAILENPGVDIRLLASDEEAFSAARSLWRKLPQEVRRRISVYRVTHSRVRRGSLGGSARRRRATLTRKGILAAFLLGAVLVAVLQWTGFFSRMRHAGNEEFLRQGEIYQPRDVERRLLDLKKEEKRLREMMNRP